MTCADRGGGGTDSETNFLCQRLQLLNERKRAVLEARNRVSYSREMTNSQLRRVKGIRDELQELCDGGPPSPPCHITLSFKLRSGNSHSKPHPREISAPATPRNSIDLSAFSFTYLSQVCCIGSIGNSGNGISSSSSNNSNSNSNSHSNLASLLWAKTESEPSNSSTSGACDCAGVCTCGYEANIKALECVDDLRVLIHEETEARKKLTILNELKKEFEELGQKLASFEP